MLLALRRGRLPSGLHGAALAIGLLWAGLAQAGVPAAYKAMVLHPSGVPARWEFDLTAALERAQRERKRLYVYLGADDCPYCRKYEAFLAAHAAELVPYFQKEYMVVDLRSNLRAGDRLLHFRIGEKVWNYREFQQSLGDERARLLVYPSVWLLSPQGRPLMQMPAGTGTFETVPEQLEILRLEQ